MYGGHGYVTSEKERWRLPRALNREQSTTNSDSSNDFGRFSSVSSIDSEESEVSEVESDLETVEPYQFEPVASDSSTESDIEADGDDSGVEDRLCSRDW